MLRIASWVSFVTFALLLVAERSVVAQIAPTGAHYAGRSSDTGHSGPDDRGGYSTSIPLDLPPSRGGLPIPVQIVSGGKGFGAAGVGWDVPLSFVYVDKTYAHRRPAMAPGWMLSPRERLSVYLLGTRVEMLPKQIQGETRWVGRLASNIEMRSINGTYVVYDGNGLTYTFLQDSLLVQTGGAGTGGMWLLDSIAGRGGAKVQLTYAINSVNLPDAPTPSVARSVDLTRISYNRHPSGTCFKNTVELLYNTPSNPQPQSLSVLGNRVLVRDHRIEFVDITSRSSCTTSPVQLRRYSLTYQPDLDTQQDRLASVTMSGRAGTPEASASVPVSSFTYGSATTTSGTTRVLRYTNTYDLDAPLSGPTSPFPTRIARTDEVSTSEFQAPYWTGDHGTSFGTTHNLIDVTGDGRPDLVHKNGGQLTVKRNLPTPSGQSAWSQSAATLTDSTFTRPFLDISNAIFDRFNTSMYGYNEDVVIPPFQK